MYIESCVQCIVSASICIIILLQVCYHNCCGSEQLLVLLVMEGINPPAPPVPTPLLYQPKLVNYDPSSGGILCIGTNNGGAVTHCNESAWCICVHTCV